MAEGAGPTQLLRRSGSVQPLWVNVPIDRGRNIEEVRRDEAPDPDLRRRRRSGRTPGRGRRGGGEGPSRRRPWRAQQRSRWRPWRPRGGDRAALARRYAAARPGGYERRGGETAGAATSAPSIRAAAARRRGTSEGRGATLSAATGAPTSTMRPRRSAMRPAPAAAATCRRRPRLRSRIPAAIGCARRPGASPGCELPTATPWSAGRPGIRRRPLLASRASPSASR